MGIDDTDLYNTKHFPTVLAPPTVLLYIMHHAHVFRMLYAEMISVRPSFRMLLGISNAENIGHIPKWCVSLNN